MGLRVTFPMMECEPELLFVENKASRITYSLKINVSHIQEWDLRWGDTCFQIDIYGVLFLFNLETLPVLDFAQEQLTQTNFSLHPLH